MRRLVAVVVIAAAATGCSSGNRVVVAVGTTLVDSGFIERVFAAYETDARVSVVGVSSLEALALGGGGSADLLITHLPEAEAVFLDTHPDARQRGLFTSRFLLVGPPHQTVVPEGAGIVEAFRAISAAGAPFVGRGDGSGTATKEKDIWRRAGIDPTSRPWYTETGQGMGFTLQVADQRGAFTIVERGTFLAIDSMSLLPTAGPRDTLLINPYTITLVGDPAPPAEALFDWLSSSAGGEAIVAANNELFGELVYLPAR
ncbi:MAG: substrate-binding domain-containing protein [Acidimicrobiia bacterium]|nr:MAG: substrate-binding domain-containing protein [Acidimicrobiia bacterium]